MLDFNTVHDEETGELVLETSLQGQPLLTTTQLNKSTAFSPEERRSLKLLGKLPYRVETLQEQVDRAYRQYSAYHAATDADLQKNIYLNNLHDKNQVLFYELVSQHLNEMLPVIYTPVVGLAVKQYSHEFRQPRGIYLSYSDREYMEEILLNRSTTKIDVIVVTDGESILGIGDQGIGGIDIPIAKLMVYTLCGGINPSRTLPIYLDVGTNNPTLLADPFYLGWRHERISGKEYDDFIAQFVHTVKKVLPYTFLHWEDFGARNARQILKTYEKELCTFNDDIQGTGVVTLSALLAGVNVTNTKLSQQRIVVYGAGSAGTGISDQIVEALCREGLTREEAYQRFWLIDRQGLLLASDPTLLEAQRPYARLDSNYSGTGLLEVVTQVKPTVLIGCSGQGGAFTSDILHIMSQNCAQPIILPISNPTELCEATPENVLMATDGRALVATGTRFDPVTFNGQNRVIAQCNNALAFPGLGQGLVSSQAKNVTQNILWAACESLSQQSPALKDPTAPLLPPLDEAQHVGLIVAKAVAHAVIQEGLSSLPKEKQLNIDAIVEHRFWKPGYLPCRAKSK